ncbi:hypothetical protein DSUL_50167 [Desulfovibrionales bacterium]
MESREAFNGILVEYDGTILMMTCDLLTIFLFVVEQVPVLLFMRFMIYDNIWSGYRAARGHLFALMSTKKLGREVDYYHHNVNQKHHKRDDVEFRNALSTLLKSK